jgi:hypothetical protein
MKGVKYNSDEERKQARLESQRKYDKSIKEKKKIYYKDNQEKINEYNINYNKDYRVDNKEKIAEYNKKHQKDNNEHYSDYRKNRRKTDPLYKLKSNIRRSIRSSFNQIKKPKTTIEILGCSFEDFKLHL